MTAKELQKLLPFLYNHRIKGQREERVDALIRMYVAIHDMICVTSLYDYENRRRTLRKIDALYKTLNRTSVKGLCRMYRLTKEVTLSVYGEKDMTCSALYHELLDRYLGNPDSSQELDVMRCIVFELGNVLEGNVELDYYEFFRNKSRQWISELDADGCWDGLAVDTALSRIDILQYNYYAFQDASLNDAILKAFHYYKTHVVFPREATAEDLRWLGAWYDLLRSPGFLPRDQELLARIARIFGDFAATANVGSDAWYEATGYAVVHCCANVIADMERELLLRIA